MACGIIMSGLTYRDMSTENLLHARSPAITLHLDRRSDAATSRFNLYRPGPHLLYLTTVNNFGSPGIEEGPIFSGTLEVSLRNSRDGAISILKRTGAEMNLRKPSNMEWTTLDTVDVGATEGIIWTITASVIEPDSAFAGTTSEVFLFPPQTYDIGWYMFGKTIQLVATGSLILIGFLIFFFSGLKLRKKAKQA